MAKAASLKKARVQSRKAPPAPRRALRERRTSLEAFGRLDRSAIIFVIFMVALIHWAIRVFTSPVLTIEEADALLLSQSFQLGYEARQPPMLAWLNWLGALAGPNTAIVWAIKYFLYFIALTFYYLAARNVLARPGISAAAVGAWALTFQVGWGMHEDLLGAVALMAALSVTLHAMTRILAWRRNRDWVYFGASVGLGLLTHHLYAVFPFALLLAIRLSPFPIFRDALKLGQLLTTIIVALAVYSPYAIWVATHPGSIADGWATFAETWTIDAGWIDRVRNGGLSLGETLLEFTLPLSLFWLTLFFSLWLPVVYPVFARRSTDEEPHEEAWRRLFARTMAISALVWLIGVVVGVQTYKGYWILPVLFCGPIWMFSHVRRAGEFPVAIRAFAAVVVMFIGLVMVGRVVEWRVEIMTCEDGDCRPYTPVKDWAEELRAAGFEDGTIVGADVHLTGNMRAAFPKARVLDASKPPSAYPGPDSAGACLAVWRDFTYDAERKIALMPPDLQDYLTEDMATPPRDTGAEGAIRRNLILAGDQAATLYFQFIPPSEGCR